MTVHFSAQSDDWRVDLNNLDCTSWFEQASDQEIIDLANCDWQGDYAADAVARFYEDSLCKPLFDYLDLRPTQATGDSVGFEVQVDRDQAMAWLKQHRRSLFDEIGDPEDEPVLVIKAHEP